MQDKSITISFSIPTRTMYDGLIMEQEPWAGGVGVVTKLDLVKSLSNALYGTEDSNDIDCGVDDNYNYLSGLFVYPFNISLSYQVGITNGELGDPVPQDVEVREMISFSLEDESSAKYPVQEVISYEWGAETWGSDGGVTEYPDISIEGNNVILSKKVYGTVILTYMTFRYAYRLFVPPREDSVENVYDSYAWSRWDGGVKLLKLEPPEGSEQAYFDQQNCFWSGRLTGVTHPDDPGDPLVSGNGSEYSIDYCTQRVIDNNV